MKKTIFTIACLLAVSFCGCKNSDQVAVEVRHTEFSVLPVWHPDYRTAETMAYDSGTPEEDELRDVQSPIPMKDRVRNHTGTQCVFSSLECLARWAECKQLLEPEPITSRSGCRSFSSPTDAARKLDRFGVKYENSYRNREQGLSLIRKAMKEGRGCLFGVPGHAMTLVHFDEQNNVVKWIDNSDRSLRIQTADMAWFNRRWDLWALVIYADVDVIPGKLGKFGLANEIPIVDHNNPQGEYPEGYIPFPSN